MGTQESPSSTPNQPPEDDAETTGRALPPRQQDALQTSEVSTHTFKSSNWTDLIPRTDHNKLFLDCDYGPTTLGPTSEWGPALRAYATMVFAQNCAACVYWGPNRTAFYNERFAISCGGAHPFLMGHGFADAFPEVAKDMVPVFELVNSSQQAVDVDDVQLFLLRNGYLEESYFLGQFIPLRGDSGEIEGCYNTFIETTEMVISKRRRQVIDGIASIAPGSVEQTLDAFMQTLQRSPFDYTAVLLYSYNDLAPRNTDNIKLEGKIGVPEGHPCAPAHAHLGTGQDGFLPYLRDVANDGQLRTVTVDTADLLGCNGLLDGIEWCGYGEPSQEIVICAVEVGGRLLGFLVHGTNPRRAYDETTAKSVADVVTQLKVKWAAALSSEQADLREQALEARATDSENRLRHMAMNAPLGMCQLDSSMNIQWANDQFYEIFGHDRSKPNISDIVQNMATDERDKELTVFDRHLLGASRTVREVRLARTWTPPTTESAGSEPINAWILSVTFPYIENGKVTMLLGYIIDISHQKWAENVQAHNAAIAVQAERRQEEFLDITSHELRNPLNAITQLADAIAKSVSLEAGVHSQSWHEIAKENADAAETILACVAHQKRVVDDILLLSRLDSQVMSINPSDVRMDKIVSDTIKMFKGLAMSYGTRIEARRGADVGDLRDVEVISTDTSRLTQLLINMLTNALKFTAPRARREIQVIYGLQAQQPSSLNTAFGDIAWFPSMGSEYPAASTTKAKTREDSIYAYFLVQDTGPGLTPDGIGLLFKRFSQATTKTELTYGGSGIGLYICRKIVEMQGGRVGVASMFGEGAVFAFYLPTTALDRADHQQLSLRIEDEVEAVQKVTKSAQEATALPSERFDILLVEDNMINQKIIAKQLRKAGCKVAVANDGEEALEVIERSDCWRQNSGEVVQATTGLIPIQVVLMDVEMPRMNGIECTKRIRRLQLEGSITRPLSIIATTANARQGQQDSLFASGVDSVLTKPFTTGVLLSKIGEVVRQYSAQS